MDRLILFRHGQAEAQASSGEDFDRALSPDGVAEAASTAWHLVEAGWVPDLALVSEAPRAVQTWGAAQAAFPAARAQTRRDLYLAPAEHVLALVESRRAEPGTLMVVGHNPGLHEAAVALAAAAGGAQAARLRAGLGTAWAVQFAFGPAGPVCEGIVQPWLPGAQTRPGQ